LGDCLRWAGFFENCSISSYFGQLIVGINVLDLTQNVLGYILGDTFTNSSGTDVMIFKTFSQKNRRKNWHF
jgi:hypothetical protein